MRRLRGALAGALGVLLGLQLMRTFLTGLVWMIGESLHPNAMGMIAMCVAALGLLAGVVRGELGRERAERLTAPVLAGLYLAALFVPDTPLRVGLSAAGTMVWIWWFSAFLDGRRPLAAALVGGLSLDLAIRAGLHGLDLPFAGSLAGAFLVGAFFVMLASVPEPESSSPGWGVVALAPWLFIQMEVLTNIARLRMVTGLSLAGVVLLAEIGLAVALLVMTRPMPWVLRVILGLAAALVLLRPAGLPWVLLAQAGLGAALAGALHRGSQRLFFPVSIMMLFSLFFIFYINVTWSIMPAAGALLLALVSLAVRSAERLSAPQRFVLIPLVMALAGLIAMAGRPVAGSVAGRPREPGAVRLMSYNIHQAMDYRGLPSPERIASAIASESPDIVALQEVNRGWTIAGASDFVSWLERRLPEYQIVYGPMVGDLWGTVILSQLPVIRSGFERFRPGVRFTTGFSWAEIDLPGCRTLVISTHLASGRQLGGERYGQMQQLLDFWDGRPCTVIMGDTNAEPNSRTIQLMLSAGFTDWLGRMTRPRAATWPSHDPFESIDYIATTGEFEGLQARALQTQASDHRPVIVDVRVVQD